MAVFPSGSASCYILRRSRSSSSFGAGCLKGSGCGQRRRHLSGRHPVFLRPSLLAPPPPLLAPLSPSSCPSFFSSTRCSSSFSELRTSCSGLGKPLRASPLQRRAKWPRYAPRASVPWIVETRSPIVRGPPSCLGPQGGKDRLGNANLGLLLAIAGGRLPGLDCAWVASWAPVGGSLGSPGLGGSPAPNTSLACLSGVSSCCYSVHWIATGSSCPRISSVLGKADGHAELSNLGLLRPLSSALPLALDC